MEGRIGGGLLGRIFKGVGIRLLRARMGVLIPQLRVCERLRRGRGMLLVAQEVCLELMR
jgi:hypothetical protein